MDNSSANSNFTYSNEEIPDQHSENDVDLLRTKYKEGSNRVYHDFFKTKMCNLYLLNICKKGAECPFAHSDDELREKPNLYKTKLCPAFLEEGHCKRGENCNFAHGEEQLRSTPDLFKTAICNLWTQGKCFSGERCRFAHGYEDLRPAPSHHKFKKTNYNKAFNNNQNNPKGHQGHQGHQGHHHKQNGGGGHGHHQAPGGFNQGPGGFNQGPPFSQGPAFNQFYSQPGFPTGPFAYPMNPMFSMPPPMQGGYQDPNMMGNFLDSNAGMQYQPHKNNYKKDSF